MSAPDDPGDEARAITREVAAMRASARRRVVQGLGLAVALIASVTAMDAHGRSVRSFVRGEVDLDGEPRFEPEHPPDPEALARIDFERVHAVLIPTWTIALANATSPYWRRHADDRFQELADAVAPDPNLHALLTRTHQTLRSDPIGQAHRLDYRLWAYNDYLDRQRVPWRLEAALVLGEERAIFHTFSYEVVADARTREGHRLRLLRRADPTSSVEGWLGKTGPPEEGAMVLMRRVLHFTVRHVWPGMHPALDARRPAEERPWLPPVRSEVADALDEESLRVLRETAVDQQALIEVAAAIEARAECGSRFRLHALPYNGLSGASLRSIYRALARSQARPDCPEITIDEAARIVGASERLAQTDGLEDAVERLAMVVARSVAVHELRHVADGEALACPGCPEGLDGLAREEVSAYLSAFADPDTGYLALLQACSSPVAPTLHSQAMQRVIEAVLPLGCTGPTLLGLDIFAGAIEEELFGPRPRVVLPELPDRVPLLPRARRAQRAPVRAAALPSGWGLSITTGTTATHTE